MITLNSMYNQLVGEYTPQEIIVRIDREDICLDGNPCKTNLIHKAIKIATLVNCSRFDSYDFEDIYNIDLPVGNVIHISNHGNTSYYLFASISGNIKSIKVTDWRTHKDVTVSNTTTTCSDKTVYKCHAVNGSRWLFGTTRNSQIYRHIIVAVAFGIYDNLDIEEIYTSVLNHKDGDIFNNSLDNLELCTQSENAIHGKVMQKLRDNNIHTKLSAKDAVKLFNLSKLSLAC